MDVFHFPSSSPPIPFPVLSCSLSPLTPTSFPLLSPLPFYPSSSSLFPSSLLLSPLSTLPPPPYPPPPSFLSPSLISSFLLPLPFPLPLSPSPLSLSLCTSKITPEYVQGMCSRLFGETIQQQSDLERPSTVSMVYCNILWYTVICSGIL